MKPSPVLFDLAFKPFGVGKEDAVFVGDSLVNDIEGAKAFGISTVWINPARSRSRSAGYVVSDLRELVTWATRYETHIASEPAQVSRVEYFSGTPCRRAPPSSRKAPRDTTRMEAVLFIGLPGSGKTSFFKERFFSTHLRISLDLLRTRHREWLFLEACLATEQRFVIDNTNPTRAERSRYLAPAQAGRFAVVGYYFQSKVEDCLRRNAARPDTERVPDVAIYSAAKRMERPTLDEGFDRLYYVRLEEGLFVVEEWRDEI